MSSKQQTTTSQPVAQRQSSTPTLSPSQSASNINEQQSNPEITTKQPTNPVPGTPASLHLRQNEEIKQNEVEQLRQLLELREKELQVLKFELEKYKLALHQSQVDYHFTQQRQQLRDKQTANDNFELHNKETINSEPSLISEIGTLIAEQEDDTSEPFIQNREQAFDAASSNVDQLTLRKRFHRISSASTNSTSPAPRVLFKAGSDDDETNPDEHIVDNIHENLASNLIEGSTGEDTFDDIIQDVSEIDLNLEIQVVDSKKNNRKTIDLHQPQKRLVSASILSGKGEEDDDTAELEQDITLDEAHDDMNEDGNKNHDDDDGIEDDDGDIITDGLLTSLTDAAICNLSQLAALQERCESQQQHSHPYTQTSPSPIDQEILPVTGKQQQQQQQHHHHQEQSALNTASTPLSATSPSLGSIGQLNQNVVREDYSQHNPFSTSAIANQAAIAINAAAAAVAAASNNAAQQQPGSSSSSISPNSSIQTELISSHSLASVVAAAAVAAAAANDQQQQHNQQHPHHLPHQQLQQQHSNSHLNSQIRLISSAIPSPEFYHTLHHPSHIIQQPQQLHSSVSSLHYSPSTSVTPSSSSLLAHTRRSASNASSSLMSPISSPNYLRRQFMPDRLPLLSPSPTSGLGTGSSSGASSGLAHILQQRSASALAGAPMTPSTAASTPMSAGGSTAVSPLMNNKNSTQARLNNMQIRHKFGYLGSGRAQFNSPHGFCLGLNQEIVVADTNNHRICIFDKSGTYITQFGSPGKEEGQLWNPRKVAILNRPVNSSGSNSNASVAGTSNQLHQFSHHPPYPSLNLQHHQQIHHNQAHLSYSSHSNNLHSSISHSSGATEPLYVVCDRGAERSRMQLFTKDGAFIKKIGIHYIDIVAGLAITQNGLIIVVDSVSPTVYIINGETGILNGWFDCSGHMKEPSDIAVKSDVPGNEYFICDFKGHCVVVFSEQGEYLRKIGHDGLTSYPNGIDISDDGDILVGDSHGNRFHVVVFDRNGNFVSQFECPHVKVSRCCGLKITREGYIVTLAKNNHHVLVLDTIHI